MSDLKLITSGQLAQVLGFPKKSIYVLVKKDSSSLPPACHVGQSFRWLPTVVQNWINQEAEGTPSDPFSSAHKKYQRFPILVEGGEK